MQSASGSTAGQVVHPTNNYYPGSCLYSDDNIIPGFKMKRSKSTLKFLSVIASFLVVVGCGSSDTGMSGSDTTMPSANPSFTGSVSASLSGSQTVPAIPTRATGTVSMQLDTTDGTLTGNIVHSVTDATVAHIHSGAIGQPGGPVIVLESTSGNEFSVPTGTVLSADEIATFIAGDYYVNVHSSTHPGGEIRGQLTNEVVVIPVLANLDDIQAKVFTPICSVCHTGGGNSLPGIMDLSTADASYASLVGADSISVPELLRIAEADVDNSYLIDKIEGRQSVGARMPFRSTPLSAETISAIRSWVEAGAQR